MRTMRSWCRVERSGRVASLRPGRVARLWPTVGNKLHSKTWIIDDDLAITGSPNCNRRGWNGEAPDGWYRTGLVVVRFGEHHNM